MQSRGHVGSRSLFLYMNTHAYEYTYTYTYVFAYFCMYTWVWVNTYRYIFSGMNIHLPAMLGFTRYQGFDPSPNKFNTFMVDDPFPIWSHMSHMFHVHADKQVHPLLLTNPQNQSKACIIEYIQIYITTLLNSCI